jgi:hypothetical protein
MHRSASSRFNYRTVDIGLRPLGSSEGTRVVIQSVRITDAGVCGREVGLSETAPSAEQRPEQCWDFEDISTIGQPRDTTVVGYYPVRGYLRCPAGN